VRGRTVDPAEHLGLVYQVAWEFVRRGAPLDLEELVSVGNEALVRAARRYDPNRGCAFSTYAVAYIRGCVLQAISRRHPLRPVYRPDHPGSTPPPDLVSLDEPVRHEGDRTLADLIPVFNDDLDHAEGRIDLAAWLSVLPPREREVIWLRYVLDLTQEEIAARLGVSQPQVSRLFRRGLGMLRAALEEVGARAAG
jgi:RNA polymerase sigma factor (sigma-70 family)